tara:strand:- start:83779 stop:84297 length:519 start_codon:yes stop_codon:yes gene_type:complete
VRNNNIKTLIMDDNRQMRTLLSAILGAFGFKNLIGASSIKEAQELWREHRFDLVIVDQRMGDQSGLDYVRWLRQKHISPSPFVPVIVVSSYSEKTRIIEAINAGVDEFLVKPLRPVDLARRIDSVTYKRRDFVHTVNFFGPDRRRFDNPHFRGPFKRIDDPQIAENEVFEFE